MSFKLTKEEYGEELSYRTYNASIAGLLCYGFLVNILICWAFEDYFTTVNPLAFLIGYFALAIAGMFIALRWDSAVGAFVGYNMIVLPIGAAVSICVTGARLDAIFFAAGGTAIICAGMLLAALARPSVFERIGSTLIVLLGFTILAELLMVIFLQRSSFLIDFVVVVIMAGFIGYDFIKANQSHRTLRNAVLYAIDLYLDAINIFIRLISLKEGSSSKKN